MFFLQRCDHFLNVFDDVGWQLFALAEQLLLDHQDWRVIIVLIDFKVTDGNTIFKLETSNLHVVPVAIRLAKTVPIIVTHLNFLLICSAAIQAPSRVAFDCNSARSAM
ncbi:MAG: hypothetical protein EBR73_17675 [Rhodobacteraceae bacterium]|nr:hypothetical protein [Paracoccaceae bacterium]